MKNEIQTEFTNGSAGKDEEEQQWRAAAATATAECWCCSFMPVCLSDLLILPR